MKFETLLIDLISGSDFSAPHVSLLVKQLLEYRASLKDGELNSTLLQTLVFKYAQSEKELVLLNQTLCEKQKKLDDDLKAAAEIQKCLLPRKTLEFTNLEIAWNFEPCEHIGGDIFNIFQLDRDHCGIYMLDVSGHGVQAALVTASVSQFLKPDADYSLFSPSKTFQALRKEFPFERFETFFTIVYVVINTRTGHVTYSRAGHPYPVLLRKNGTLELLKKGEPVIGIDENEFFIPPEERVEENQLQLNHGDKLFIYTDGIIEYENLKKKLFGSDRFFQKLSSLRDNSVSDIIASFMTSLMKFGEGAPPLDDLTLLGIEMKNQTKA